MRSHIEYIPYMHMGMHIHMHTYALMHIHTDNHTQAVCRWYKERGSQGLNCCQSKPRADLFVSVTAGCDRRGQSMPVLVGRMGVCLGNLWLSLQSTVNNMISHFWGNQTLSGSPSLLLLSQPTAPPPPHFKLLLRVSLSFNPKMLLCPSTSSSLGAHVTVPNSGTHISVLGTATAPQPVQ